MRFRVQGIPYLIHTISGELREKIRPGLYINKKQYPGLFKRESLCKA